MPLDYSPTQPPRPSAGPFVCAALSTFFATGLLIAIKFGLVLNLITTLAVLIPGMVFATMAISISMGWIFIALGRYKSQPRWVYAAAFLMLITMLELLVLTYLADAAGKIQ